MQHKPGRVGRILAVLFLAIAVPACAQILGDDYEIKEGPIGGGDCNSLDCGGCSLCALDTECTFERDDCDALGCAPYGDCCSSCPENPDCETFCDCSGGEQRFFVRENCIANACFGCGGSSVAVGGGA